MRLQLDVSARLRISGLDLPAAASSFRAVFRALQQESRFSKLTAYGSKANRQVPGLSLPRAAAYRSKATENKDAEGDRKRA